MDASEQTVVDYLKKNGLFETWAAAAGVAKVDVADVHVPAALPPAKKTTTTVTVIEEAAAPASAKEVGKALVQADVDIVKRSIHAADLVFFKGEANLYVQRPLTPGSAVRLHAWAVEQGIPNLVPPELMHVTQVHSTAEVDTDAFEPLSTVVDIDPDSRWIGGLGDNGALVLFFRSPLMSARHEEAKQAGASWDFPIYIPHITLSYDAGDHPGKGGMLTPPDFPIQLGPELFVKSNDDWVAENGLAKRSEDWGLTVDIQKSDDERQMIFGWASITHLDGKVIVDKQNDAILLVDTMIDGKLAKGLESATYDYVLTSREHGDMHSRIGTGGLVEAMVFTPDKAAAGLVAKNDKGQQIYGLWVGYRLDNDMWKRFKAGDLPEFSIGGKSGALSDPEAEAWLKASA